MVGLRGFGFGSISLTMTQYLAKGEGFVTPKSNEGCIGLIFILVILVVVGVVDHADE